MYQSNLSYISQKKHDTKTICFSKLFGKFAVGNYGITFVYMVFAIADQQCFHELHGYQ
jgi:hypothetical protein